MFKAIRISRFRGFIDVKLEQLGRCNLIIGPNNVGKTSLLEALFLLLGPTNPDLAMMVNGFRGLERFRPNPEDMWGWLFQGKDLSQHIEITARVDARRDRRLIIEIGSGATRIKTGKPNRDIERRRSAATASTSLPPGQLVLTYTNESGQRTVTKTVLKDAGEIGVEREGKLEIPDSVYVSSRGGHAPENAERFSKLAEVGRDGEV
ncbi:MAG TPA: AAA family ATPase, partial [Pirellulaceae bacterium]|nr:AAA family ATPase [Pirellulaceae bacterium]